MNTKLATAQIRVKNWTAIIQDRNQSGAWFTIYVYHLRYPEIMRLPKRPPCIAQGGLELRIGEN